MAVVQISRIQIRRGQANGGTGLPQLASGEFAWAVDTQELFIGNGAVSEGAPTVGNSKIITEHDNILELAALYEYKRNDTNIVTSPGDRVQRSLQDRLDDVVSVRSFGAAGDGFVDDTAAIQRAIDQLFINPASVNEPGSKVTLLFEAGVYNITEELRIPPYAHLVGDGIDSTIITQIGNSDSTAVVFRTVDGNSIPGTYTDLNNMAYNKRPQQIYISGMTLKNTTSRSVGILDNVDSAVFDRIKFSGIYNNGDGENAIVTDTQSGVYLRSNSTVFCNTNILFKSCIFNKTGYGAYSNTETNYIMFENCTFFQLFKGISMGGGISGALNTVISKNYFDQIDQEGIEIKEGTSIDSSYGNISTANKFYIVGTNNESFLNAQQYPIIKFERPGNKSTDDYFERNRKFKNQTLFGLNAFIPNVETQGMVYDDLNYITDIIETGTVPVPVIRFPAPKSATYEIDYVINKLPGNVGGKAVRTGVLHITIDVGVSLTDGSEPPIHHIHDDFGYTGDESVENIVFSVELKGYVPETSVVDTMVINYTNPLDNGSGTLNYTYRMLTK
jgi:hypothetical protein